MTTLASPESLGFGAERLARIDRFLAERYVEPGLAAARCYKWPRRDGRLVGRA